MTEHRTRARLRADALGLDRTSVFVPAIMSVGLLFWLIGELRDLVRSAGDEARHKRARISGRAIAQRIPGERQEPLSPACRGLRQRPVYLLWAVTLIGGAAYVAVGSIRNFGRPGGYLSDIGWLLAVSIVASAGLLVLGVVAGAVFLRWPSTPSWCERVLNTSLLTTSPVEPGTRFEQPPWRTGAAFTILTAAAVLSSFIVMASTSWLGAFDRGVADWFVRVDLAWWEPISDSAYGWYGAGALAVLGVLVGIRCRALGWIYPTASALGLLITVGFHSVVDRARPLSGGLDSFPSGHLVQATVAATLFPLVVRVALHRRWIVVTLQFLLATLAVGAAIASVARSEHWPSDVISGALIGLALGWGGRWLIADQRSHARCRSCAWRVPDAVPPPAHLRHRLPHPVLGLFQLAHRPARLIRVLAQVASFLVVVGLAILSLTVGLPSNTESYVFGPGVQRPAQLALAALVSIGALVGRRRPAIGAVTIAFAACGLGVVASVEYAPGWAAGLAACVMVPAFLLWLTWQHRKAPHELAAVAVVTLLLVGSTWFGAQAVYDSYFGPTHPDSAAAALPVDEVEWVLAGAPQPYSIWVNARLSHRDRRAALVIAANDGSHTVTTPAVDPDDHGVAHLRAEGLRPGTSYSYRVAVEGRADNGRGFGTFRTPLDGPMSFGVVLASCARTGSNGKVYDAMTQEGALLYLALGDAHYGNIESTSPSAFLNAYDYMLTRPGQSAFFRSTPIAYVWDDHDYGPNDADSTSPGRSAVAEAYRSVVPARTLVDDVSVYQAFTIGRVRFVMTDNRSQRTASTMLGEKQLAWLISELTTASKTHAVVVWANSVPWIGAANPGGDGWAGYPDERRRIADAIADARIDNLVMVGGDAHMVAIDDGTNTNYSSRTSGNGFPLLQAAALDRPGNVKGGPYSDGTFPGGGQYGTLHIDDNGERVVVTLSGRTWDGRTLVSHSFTFR